ncbi:uncharacterized protein TRIADDRAFT_19304, partial [Trichoplax adhaerens]
ATRPVRIYANGVFDVFHIGHMNALKQAKNFFPNVYLMVGVYNDNIAHYKKGFTVLTQSERYESLIHCRYVDEVVTDAPLAVTPEFMEEYHIDFVANDGRKAGHSKDVYKDIKAMGRFIPTESTSGISTSEIIAKVTRNYDIYVRRNLRRGYSRKDLNVGLVKKTHYEIQDAIGELHEMVKNVEDQSQLLLQMVEGRSYEFCKRLADISANFRENWNGKLPESKEGRSKFYELDEGWYEFV